MAVSCYQPIRYIAKLDNQCDVSLSLFRESSEREQLVARRELALLNTP